jgi:hypothetical protein
MVMIVEGFLNKNLMQTFNQTWDLGWAVFYTGIQDATHNLYELQRVDELGIFESDKDAIKHVVRVAMEDASSVEADAIRFLAKESPNEIDSVFRDILGNDIDKCLNYIQFTKQ